MRLLAYKHHPKENIFEKSDKIENAPAEISNFTTALNKLVLTFKDQH